jgi:hypothetical protein
LETREYPPLNVKTSCGGHRRRQCRRSGSVHHQWKKHQQWTPWEAVPEVQERPPSTQKMSTVPPLGGGVGGPGPPTINAKNINGGPMGIGAGYPGAPNINKKISTAGPLGGDARGLGAPTINAKNVDGGPLGGGARGLRAPTINANAVDDWPRGRWCWRSGSNHHQCKRHRW